MQAFLRRVKNFALATGMMLLMRGMSIERGSMPHLMLCKHSLPRLIGQSCRSRRLCRSIQSRRSQRCNRGYRHQHCRGAGNNRDTHGHMASPRKSRGSLPTTPSSRLRMCRLALLSLSARSLRRHQMLSANPEQEQSVRSSSRSTMLKLCSTNARCVLALLVELSDLRHGMLMQKAYELSMTPRAGFETRSGQKNQNE